MTDQKILVPVDLSEVSKTVIDMAVYIAGKSKMAITLLHITKNKDDDPLEQMKNLASEAEKSSSIQFDFLVKKGSVLTEIAQASNDEHFKLMVIGSHGYKGLREKVFGADILKLLRNIPIPVLSVQKGCRIPENGFNTILFPVSSHEAFNHKIEAALFFAKLFSSEVHLYSVEKPGVKLSQNAIDNIQKAKLNLNKMELTLSE